MEGVLSPDYSAGALQRMMWTEVHRVEAARSLVREIRGARSLGAAMNAGDVFLPKPLNWIDMFS